MNEMDVAVLVEQMKNLSSRMEEGFKSIKEMIQNGTSDFKEHITKDEEKHKELAEQIITLKIETAKIKERWILITSIVSVVGGGAIELVLHYFTK